MHYISTVSTLSQTNSNQSNSDRNLSNVSENNCKRKSDPTDDISNYQKKKSPKSEVVFEKSSNHTECTKPKRYIKQ